MVNKYEAEWEVRLLNVRLLNVRLKCQSECRAEKYDAKCESEM